MSQEHEQIPCVEGLLKDVRNFSRTLSDSALEALMSALSDEQTRRNNIHNGLHVSEMLRFDETVQLIRARTGLGEADALAMIRAHAGRPGGSS